MFNGDVGGVSGGNNVQWNKKLAEELDAADGKKDGKIKASIWNGFMEKTGSSGKHIKNFINIDNASRSFNYYDKTKDSGKVDWGNWENMLTEYKQDLGLEVTPKEDPKVDPKTDPEEDPKVDPKTDPKQDPKTEPTQEQKEAFKKLDESGVLDTKPHTPEALKSGGFGANPSGLASQKDENGLYYALDMNGGKTYFNEKGESIRISEFEAGMVEGGKVEVTYTSADGKTQNHIIYGEDDKPIQGVVTVKDGDNFTTMSYKIDADGNKVLTSSVSGNDNGVIPPEADLRTKYDVEENVAKLVKEQGYKLQSDKDGVQVYTSDSGKKLTVTKNNDGTTTLLKESADAKPQDAITVDQDGYITQSSEFRYGAETNSQIEIRRNYFKDGSIQKIAFVDGKQMDDFYDGELPEIGELQYMVKDSPAKLLNSKFPTEEELLKAGYKKNETMMTMNGGILYENSQTGESIIVTEFDHSIDYRNGNIRQTQYYDKDGNITSGRITETQGNGAFKVFEYDNSDNGKLEVNSYIHHDAPTSNIDFAADALDGHANSIAEFKKTLGCPEDLTFELPQLTTNVENYRGEHGSADGNFNMKVDIDANGNVKITYAKKQSDGTFKDIGTIALTKEDSPGSLRGYDYKFEGTNLITGESTDISHASWEDGNC